MFDTEHVVRVGGAGGEMEWELQPLKLANLGLYCCERSREKMRETQLSDHVFLIYGTFRENDGSDSMSFRSPIGLRYWNPGGAGESEEPGGALGSEKPGGAGGNGKRDGTGGGAGECDRIVHGIKEGRVKRCRASSHFKALHRTKYLF